MHLGLLGMVFSFMLNYILQSNIILRQWHNYSPDPLFILSTREFYTAYTANSLISFAEHILNIRHPGLHLWAAPYGVSLGDSTHSSSFPLLLPIIPGSRKSSSIAVSSVWLHSGRRFSSLRIISSYYGSLEKDPITWCLSQDLLSSTPTKDEARRRQNVRRAINVTGYQGEKDKEYLKDKR